MDSLEHKVECVLVMVIWSEFRMVQYKDNDHREDASHFIICSICYGPYHAIHILSILCGEYSMTHMIYFK